MLEGAIAIGVVLMLAIGFYLTRGAGGMPGGRDDPAFRNVPWAGWSGADAKDPRDHDDLAP